MRPNITDSTLNLVNIIDISYCHILMAFFWTILLLKVENFIHKTDDGGVLSEFDTSGLLNINKIATKENDKENNFIFEK